METAAGWASCHAPSDQGGVALSGEVASKSPFGDIYSKSISSDATHGIGGGSKQAFLGLDDRHAFAGASGFDRRPAPPLTLERLKAAGFEAFDTTPRFGRKRERLQPDHGPGHDRSHNEFEPPQRGRSQSDLRLPDGARPRDGGRKRCAAMKAFPMSSG